MRIIFFTPLLNLNEQIYLQFDVKSKPFTLYFFLKMYITYKLRIDSINFLAILFCKILQIHQKHNIITRYILFIFLLTHTLFSWHKNNISLERVIVYFISIYFFHTENEYFQLWTLWLERMHSISLIYSALLLWHRCRHS